MSSENSYIHPSTKTPKWINVWKIFICGMAEMHSYYNQEYTSNICFFQNYMKYVSI